MSTSSKLDRRGFLATASTVAAGLALSSTAPAVLAASERTADRARVAAAVDNVVMWVPGDSGTVKNWATDPILKAVEQATNTAITIKNIPSTTDYVSYLNTAIAAGKLPDIIALIPQGEVALIDRLVRDGIIASVEGKVGAAAPNLLAIYRAAPTLAELKVNGKIYQWPVSWGNGTYPNLGLLHVRQDLLNKYGMAPPATFDQYFAFLSRARKDGLGGILFDGKNGLAGSNGNPAYNAFAGAFGLPYAGWVKVKGGYQNAYIQPGMKSALLLFRKLVAEGLVNPLSWTSASAARDKYVAGAGAALIFNGGGHNGRIQSDMDLNKHRYMDYLLPAPRAGSAQRGYTAEPQFWGTTVISNLSGNNPVAAARVLNYLASDAGYKLTALGIVGRDYTQTGGKITLLTQRTKDGFAPQAGDTGAHPLATEIVSWVPQSWQDFSLLYGRSEAFKHRYQQMWANQGRYQIRSYGLLTTSPLWTKFQPTSDDLTNRAFVQIVRSSSDAQASALFDSYVQNWKASGGAAATSEMSGVLTKIYGS